MKDEKAVSNKLIDSDWDKLTGSMLSVYGVNTCQSILKSDSKLKTSNLSLCGEAEIDSNLDRSKSVTVLTSMEQQNQEQDLSSNGFVNLNNYQKRILSSMEKLDLPSWYTCASKTVSNKYDKRMSPSTSTQTSLRSSWRTNSMTSKTSWRRKQATSFSRTSTLERSSSVEHNANSMKSQNDVKHVYLGWRSQERLRPGPAAYLTTPTQRLASSAMEDDLKQVTNAIFDFCKSSDKEVDDARSNEIKSDKSHEMPVDIMNGITHSNGVSLYSF